MLFAQIRAHIYFPILLRGQLEMVLSSHSEPQKFEAKDIFVTKSFILRDLNNGMSRGEKPKGEVSRHVT